MQEAEAIAQLEANGYEVSVKDFEGEATDDVGTVMKVKYDKNGKKVTIFVLREKSSKKDDSVKEENTTKEVTTTEKTKADKKDKTTEKKKEQTKPSKDNSQKSSEPKNSNQNKTDTPSKKDTPETTQAPTWSSWGSDASKWGNSAYEHECRYREKTMETTTSTSSNLSGWGDYVSYDFGSWGGWKYTDDEIEAEYFDGSEIRQVESGGAKAAYKYRERSVTFTYQKWSGWSDWKSSGSMVSSENSATRQVEAQYRYKSK